MTKWVKCFHANIFLIYILLLDKTLFPFGVCFSSSVGDICFLFFPQKGAMMVTKVVTVVKTKKGAGTHKKKGELMENDQDAMEVGRL